ncbi:MAG: trimethylamine methyltransferase family protein, partial [Paracoccaceae bacterium]
MQQKAQQQAGPDVPRRRRGGGRAGNAARRGTEVIDQMPWRLPVNVDRPTEPLDEAGVQAIHDGAMRILEEIGITFLNPEAVEILRRAGCSVDGETVRMGRDMVMEKVALAPAQWDITPRNPARRITIGGRHILFGNVSSPPNYWDMEIGRKVPGTREMCRNLLKLTQYFNCIHFAGGYPVEPVDLHPSVRHLDVLYDKLTLTDKAMHAYSLGAERVDDVMEMVRIAGRHSHEDFESGPKMYTNINSTSPLKHDFPMMDGWMRLARRNQGLVVTPFTLAGAMAPVTMAGAVAQSLAEALSAVVLAQV